MTELRPFGIKAYTFITTPVEDDARFTILEGSIRSSKTFSMMVKLLALCRYNVEGWRVITGVSKNTIYQNVLKDLFELVGRKNYKYNRQTGELVLFDTRWLVIGAKDEGSFKFIQGMTIGVVYCDELTNMPHSFYLMLTSRMSPPGARLYATTNPENPYHYVKTDIIDNEELIKAGEIHVIHFTLDDNPNLSRETRSNYERMYKGMFYLRYIKGLWVIAEGAIYRDVWDEGNLETGDQGIYYDDATRPIDLFSRGGHMGRYIPCDYGTHNPCVFLDLWDDGDTIWIEREYYWSSVEERLQKTDTEYGNDMERFLRGETLQHGVWRPHQIGENLYLPKDELAEIIIDPSAASFRLELVTRGLWVTDANNEVLDGIRRVSSMLGKRKIRIHRHNCPKTSIEMQTYAWDPKQSLKGEDKPIKANDHAPDAIRYGVETKVLDWRIAA